MSNFMVSFYKKHDFDSPLTIVYENEVELKCNVCGGCDNIGSCKQQEELKGCSMEREIFPII